LSFLPGAKEPEDFLLKILRRNFPAVGQEWMRVIWRRSQNVVAKKFMPGFRRFLQIRVSAFFFRRRRCSGIYWAFDGLGAFEWPEFFDGSALFKKTFHLKSA
jgi:hypothetical protein